DASNNRLPATRPGQLQAAAENRALALDVSDEKRADDDEIDLLAYWRILVKRKWLALGVPGTVGALALVATLRLPPVDRATATRQMDRESLQIMNIEGAATAEGAAPDFLQTQYELLKSRTLAERVANELGIDDQTLERLASATWMQRARGSL